VKSVKGFGERIKIQRKRKKLTQEALGEVLDVTKSYISKVESESTVPKLEMLVKIADALEVDVVDLIGNKKEPPAELKAIGAEWIVLGEELEREGFTPEQVKLWAEIVKKSTQNTN
jgi:XRE family transcriptional regulator, master regulator for biofilm formation